MEAAVKEKNHLLETIEGQEINAADVERMNNEKASLDELFSNVVSQTEAQEKIVSFLV
jgi:hypothetical protein